MGSVRHGTAKRLAQLAAATAGLLAIFAASISVAAEPATIQIVFDGSGSMWGKLPGDANAKFVTAREALRQSLAGISSRSTQVGLVGFGHRRPGECSDVEQMLPPQAVDAERIAAPLIKFNPKGRGPIALALRRAAQALPGAGPESLILIHDDPDNCQDDPCSAAAEIHRAKPRLAVHVISIGMKSEDVERMACVTKTTGGKLFDAQTPQAVAGAIDEAVRLASLEPPVASAIPAPQPAARPPETGAPGLRLAASLGAESEVLEKPVKWRITKQPADAAMPPIELTASFPNITLTPGSYAVEARLGLAEARQTIEVAGSRPTRVTIPLNAGIIQFGAGTFKDASPQPTAVISVEEQPERGSGGRVLWLGTAEPAELVVPAGTYRVVLQDRQYRSEKIIAVPSGSQGAPLLASTAARIQLQARDVSGGLASGLVSLSVLEDDPTDPSGRREVASTAANRANFTLPAGTYHAVARKGVAEVRELVVLRAGEDVTKALTLTLGRLALGVRLAGSSDAVTDQVAYRIIGLDEQGREVARADGASPEIELPAGRYRIESRLGSQNAVVSRDIEIKAGTEQSLVIDQPAASVRLRLSANPGGAAIPDVFWEVRDGAGQTVWRAIEGEPRGILAAGRYSIRAEVRDRRVEKTVDIRGGEARTLEFTVE